MTRFTPTDEDVRAVRDVLVAMNKPMTRDDPPYPACLTPIARAAAQAVIDQITARSAADALEAAARVVDDNQAAQALARLADQWRAEQ